MNETEAIHYGRTKTAQEAAREFAKDCDRVVIKLGKAAVLLQSKTEKRSFSRRTG